MKDLFLRSWLVFSLLVAISPCNRVDSCYVEPDWSDTRAVFFNPELGNDSTGLRPFFYSYQYLFPNDYDGFTSLGDGNKMNDYQRNCREWQEYLGKKVDLDDIYKVIYGTSADSFSTARQTGTLNDFLPGNSFLKVLQKPANAAALQYLDFAKRFEFQQFESGSDPWEEPEYYQNWFKQDSVMLDRLAEESARGLATASGPFLQQRWAYQRINTLYYQAKEGAEDTITQVFKKYFDIRRDKTILLPWALLKVAEVNPDNIEANYQLALVFDRCQSKRLRAIQLFESKSAEKTLPYARSAREKAAILTLRDIQFPGRSLPELKRIAQLSPGTPYFPLLLTREINKLEDWILTTPLTGMDAWHSFRPDYEWDENYDRKMDRWTRLNAEKDREYLHAVRAFVAQMAEKQRNNRKLAPFLQLALAHLYYMEQRYTDAWRTLQHTPTKGDARWQVQKKIQETLLLPLRTDVRKKSTQTALVERLHYIRQNAGVLTDPARQLSRIYLALGHAFWRKKDMVTAGLLFGRASEHTATRTKVWWDASGDALGFYDSEATMEDMDSLERLLTKKTKTPFETYFTQPLNKAESARVESEWSFHSEDEVINPVPGIMEIRELKGMFALRDGDLKRAVAELAEIDTAYWNQHNDYWNVDICGSSQFIAADSLPPMPENTKYNIVKKMLDLETEAARNPAKRAENYYLLGNAWFHCSYWGRANGMFTRYSSIYETDANDPYRRGPTYLSNQPKKKYHAVYYRCARAAAYFRKSLAARPDPELGARAFYMLAECDRRDRWMSMRRGNKDEGSVASPLFRMWEKRYANTEAYRKCLAECPDLRTYLGK